MSDLISREKLLNEINLLKKSPWYNKDFAAVKLVRKDAVAIVEKCVEEAPGVPQWISVEDKTADIGKPILLYSEPTGYILGQFVREEEFVADDGCPMSIAYLLGIYAYWTYLPEPPKENKP